MQINAIPEIGPTFIRWEEGSRLLNTFRECNLNLPLTRGAIVAIFSEKNSNETHFLKSTPQLENC